MVEEKEEEEKEEKEERKVGGWMGGWVGGKGAYQLGLVRALTTWD